MNICDKGQCAGCGLCSNVCPKSCIRMEPNEIGHIYPIVEKEKCIECHLCKRYCPANSRLNQYVAKEAYACWDNNKEERKKAASGGIATKLARCFVKNGGVVFGSAFTSTGIRHIRVDDELMVETLRGTKYVESPIFEVLHQVKTDVGQGRKVLFIGTPCQCSAIRSLVKSNPNVFIVEIICTGVPPQKLLWEHIKTSNVAGVSFRDETGVRLTVWDKNNQIIYQKPVWDDYYLMAFSKHLCFRDSCYNCKYASSERIGDLTLGDFWGLGKSEPFTENMEDGVSVVLVNNDQGKLLFDEIKKEIAYWKRKVSEAIEGNPRYLSPSKPHKKRASFIYSYPSLGVDGAVKKALRLQRVKYLAYKVLRVVKHFR